MVSSNCLRGGACETALARLGYHQRNAPLGLTGRGKRGQLVGIHRVSLGHLFDIMNLPLALTQPKSWSGS